MRTLHPSMTHEEQGLTPYLDIFI
uniref:Uncharacterized protein n=1 Tax=Anguilla anguilla TaxID=7936 RepID=A0A0E9Q928_ANGAN